MSKEELITSLSRIESWREFFAVLVAIGIVGEVWLGFRLSSRSNALQTVEEREKGELNLKIERLRKENLTLEAAVSDRLFKDQGGSAERLRKYAGTKVVITYADTKEAKSTAEQIAYVLVGAKWELLPRSTLQKKIVLDGGVNVFGQNDKAVSALIEELNRTDIRQMADPYPHPLEVEGALGEDLLRKAVVVVVGPKPDVLMEKRIRDTTDRAIQDSRRIHMGIRIHMGNTLKIPE